MRVRVRFTGRVQGVGFRATTRHVASRHPVSGWVRNEPDGSVLCEAQGTSSAVEGFLADVRRTMSAFIVNSAATEVGEEEGESGFVIQR